MIYLYKKLILITGFFSLICSNAFGQAELGFLDNLQCNDYTYCIDLEINASLGNSFDMGTSSFLLAYDSSALLYKSYTPVEFDATMATCPNVWASQKIDYDSIGGYFGLTIKLLDDTGTCLTVNNSPKVIGMLCFDILKQGAIPNVTFDNLNTRINRHIPDDGSTPVSLVYIDTLNTPNSLACDCAGLGDPCDDLNVLTINDQFDINCDCIGAYEDVDVDGIYDGVDNCLDVFYEAEAGNINWAGFKNNNYGYFGTGFVDFASNTGDTLAVTIVIDSLAEYDLIFRYTNGSSAVKTLELMVDSVVLEPNLNFPQTSSWSNWQEVFFTDSLEAGTHIVYLITTGVAGPNLDRIAISSCGNCAMAGTACDDGDPCTDLDIYDADCNCHGVYSDSDDDGVCDNSDICPDGDDNIDTDMDGTPDACDDCDNDLIGQSCDDNDPCTINDIYDSNCNCVGTFTGNDSDMDGICDVYDTCSGFDDNLDEDGDSIPNGCDPCNDLVIGQPCDDGNPCTILDVVTEGCSCSGIPIYLELDKNIDTPGCNGTLASIDITPEHMVGGVYFQWNNGASTEDLTDLAPGTYSVTATDWRNCSVIDTIVISELNDLELSFTTTASGGSNGEIDMTVTGGVPPYIYNWGTGDTTEDLIGLTSDRYYVTVTDALACSKNLSVDILIDTMCVDTIFQYEYGEKINMETVNTNFGPAMDGYIRFGHNDAHSSVSHYYDFPEYGNYEFNIRHSKQSNNRTVNIYLDGSLRIVNVLAQEVYYQKNLSSLKGASINLHHLVPGVYTCLFETVNKIVQKEIIVVQ